MKQTCTLIFLTLCLALVACSPSTALPSPTNAAVPSTALPSPTNAAVPSTALPSPTNTAVPTATATSTPAPTATSTPAPTATPTPAPTATPTSSPEQKAKQINFPDECIHQFPLTKQEKGFWEFAVNSSPSEGLVTDFDLQLGDLLFKWVIKVEYINSDGAIDFVYVPGLTFNTAKKQTVIGSTIVNNDGAALNHPDRLSNPKIRAFIQRYINNTYTPTSKVYFGFADNQEVNSAISQGFFNPAITEIYTQEMIESFMRTGDSSILPHRLLIIYQNGTATKYCLK